MEREHMAKAQRMEALIRTYFEGCNEADAEKITSCFTPDAVHYFPPGMYDGPFRGAATIAAK
jgi:ketosteroid isomerase-like protein